jgi:hypothetical protein
VLGISPPTPPPGPPTRMLRLTLRGGVFPVTEQPYEIRIGDQTLDSLEIIEGGTAATGLLQRMPREGEPIALHVMSLDDVGQTGRRRGRDLRPRQARRRHCVTGRGAG